MSDRKLLSGKFVWYELLTSDLKKAESFYSGLLGWKVGPYQMGNSTYDMILTGDSMDSMIGGYVPLGTGGQRSHWISYVSVENVDAAAKAAAEAGGKVIAPPSDIPEVGRQARIADPQGAELCLFRNAKGDPPDPDMAHGGVPSTQAGRWVWNELHTTDPARALTFYEKVLGFSHRKMDGSPASIYYILSKGGVDRGGITGELPQGVRPHWLPYVSVDDADATLGKAKTLGGKIHAGPFDIPGVGRFGVVEDPTGGALAVIKPQPIVKQSEASKSDRVPVGGRA